MTIGIFTLKPDSYTSLRFQEESKKKNLTSFIVPYEALDWAIKPVEIQVFFQKMAIPKFDLVIFGTAGPRFAVQRDYLLSFYLSSQSKILNAESLLKYSAIDKISQHFFFQQHHFPFVETKVFGGKKQMLDEITDYPVVVKDKHGSKGMRVFKIESKNQLEELLLKFEPSSLLVQPFLIAGEDIRVITLGGKVLGAMKRIAKPGSFLTNFSAGGIVEKYAIEKDIEATKIAESISKDLLMEYGGIDLMKDKNGRWLILEFNRPCQFEGFEKATKINVAGKIIDFLLKK